METLLLLWHQSQQPSWKNRKNAIEQTPTENGAVRTRMPYRVRFVAEKLAVAARRLRCRLRVRRVRGRRRRGRRREVLLGEERGRCATSLLLLRRPQTVLRLLAILVDAFLNK